MAVLLVTQLSKSGKPLWAAGPQVDYFSPLQSGSFERASRPVEALLSVAFIDFVNGFESQPPSFPGAFDPAR